MSAPVVTYTRHRLTVDGDGVTTLVCFHGCPLRCKYCINSFSFNPNTRRMNLSAQMLYDRVKIDELYFLATGGGVTFGGGEPLLYATFLEKFRKICGESWHLCAETSLNVPWKNVEIAAGCIDEFIIDCKDTNPEIYQAYTGQDNERMLENLQKLVALVGTKRIIVRLPLIPSFNTDDDRLKSQQRLEEMGVTRFDRFTYLTPEQQALRK